MKNVYKTSAWVDLYNKLADNIRPEITRNTPNTRIYTFGRHPGSPPDAPRVREIFSGFDNADHYRYDYSSMRYHLTMVIPYKFAMTLFIDHLYVTPEENITFPFVFGAGIFFKVDDIVHPGWIKFHPRYTVDDLEELMIKSTLLRRNHI
jgi:hypothetical protein